MWFTLAGVLWVGGLGWVMYRFPERVAALNSWFGASSFLSGPKYVKFVRRIGVVEMVLAGLSVVNEVLALIFGWYR